MNNQPQQPQLETTQGDIDGVIAIGVLPLVRQLKANYNFKKQNSDSLLNGLKSLPEGNLYKGRGYTLYSIGYAGNMHFSFLTNVSQARLEEQLLTFIYYSNHIQVGDANAWLLNDDVSISLEVYIAATSRKLRSGTINTIIITSDFLDNFHQGGYDNVPTGGEILGAVVQMGQKLSIEDGVGWCSVFIRQKVLHSVVHYAYEFSQEGQILHLDYNQCKETFLNLTGATIYHPLGNFRCCTIKFPQGKPATDVLKALLCEDQNDFDADTLGKVGEVRVYIPELKNVRSTHFLHYTSKGSVGTFSVFSGFQLLDDDFYHTRFGKAQYAARAITAGLVRAGDPQGLQLRLEFVCSGLQSIRNRQFSVLLRQRMQAIFSDLLIRTPPNIIRDNDGITSAINIVRNGRFDSIHQVFAAEAYITYLLDGDGRGDRALRTAIQAALNQPLSDALDDTKEDHLSRVGPPEGNFGHVTHDMLRSQEVIYRMAFHLFPRSSVSHDLHTRYATALWEQSQLDHCHHGTLRDVLRTALSVFKVFWQPQQQPFCVWEHWQKRRMAGRGGNRSFDEIARCLLHPRGTTRGLHAHAFVESLLKGWFEAFDPDVPHEDRVEQLADLLQDPNLLDGQTRVFNAFPMLLPIFGRDQLSMFVRVGIAGPDNTFIHHQEELARLLSDSYLKNPRLHMPYTDAREIRAWGLLRQIVAYALRSQQGSVIDAFSGAAKRKDFAYTWILVMSISYCQRIHNRPNFHPWLNWAELRTHIADIDTYLNLLTSLGLIFQNPPHPHRRDNHDTLLSGWYVPVNFPTRVRELGDENNINFIDNYHPPDPLPLPAALIPLPPPPAPLPEPEEHMEEDIDDLPELEVATPPPSVGGSPSARSPPPATASRSPSPVFIGDPEAESEEDLDLEIPVPPPEPEVHLEEEIAVQPPLPQLDLDVDHDVALAAALDLDLDLDHAQEQQQQQPAAQDQLEAQEQPAVHPEPWDLAPRGRRNDSNLSRSRGKTARHKKGTFKRKRRRQNLN